MWYQLKVNSGWYESNSLVGILWEVLKHRFLHFIHGEGWRD
jgi:hypothetical protein